MSTARGTRIKPGSPSAMFVLQEMRRRNLGLRETARELGIDHGRLSRLLAGNGTPSIAELAALRRFAPHEPEVWLVPGK